MVGHAVAPGAQHRPAITERDLCCLDTCRHSSSARKTAGDPHCRSSLASSRGPACCLMKQACPDASQLRPPCLGRGEGGPGHDSWPLWPPWRRGRITRAAPGAWARQGRAASPAGPRMPRAPFRCTPHIPAHPHRLRRHEQHFNDTISQQRLSCFPHMLVSDRTH